MEQLLAGSPAEQDAVLNRICRLVFTHAFAEEAVLWPELRRHLPDGEQHVGEARLRRLGLAWEAVRRTAPTRPHPVVARRPPGNVLAALPLTVIDRSRDLVDGVSRRVPRRAAPGLARASQWLAAGAGRIEHLGPLRRGEDPTTRRSG